MKNVILVGYRGTGKTTVARLLAEKLGWIAIDADDEIEKLAGKSIKQIFADEGEPAFRDYESSVIDNLVAQPRQVLAMGGGAVLREDNRKSMRHNGIVIWLTADAATLYMRIHDDPTTSARRPNLTAIGGIDEITQLLSERQAAYEAAAHHRVDTSKRTPEEVANAIMGLV